MDEKEKEDIYPDSNEEGEEEKRKIGWYVSLPVIIIIMLTRFFPVGIILIVIRLIQARKIPVKRNLTFVLIIAIGIYYIVAGVPGLRGNEKNTTNAHITFDDSKEIKLFTFKEKGKIDSYFENNKKKSIYLKVESSLLSEDYYAMTNTDEGIEYIGEMKDNKPDGIGKIYTEGNLDYIGEFKDGRFEGYGEDYEGNYEGNLLLYDGYFKDGKYQGKGNEYYYPVDVSLGLHSESLDDLKIPMDEMEIHVGTYKKGKANGDFKIYANGCLLYDGEMKSGNKNGQGTLYFANSDQIQYKGGFRTNKYHGKGNLYDESGKVIYKGKWEMGDYAN